MAQGKTKIVCLCGSTRFTEQMLLITWELAKKGIIALGWCLVPNAHGTHLAEKENVKDVLDELHKRKIDLSDEVIVVNVGGYIGESTTNEVEYALAQGKPVQWLEPDKKPDWVRTA